MTFSKLAAAAALGLAALGGRADASVVIDITQVAGNVVATGSGTIDLSGLTLVDSTVLGSSPQITPGEAFVVVGTPSSGQDSYSGLSGPSSFGSGSSIFGSSGSGDLLGFEEIISLLFVPASYVSGTALSGSATFDGQTFATLGLTPGTYVYKWSSDSLTVKIGTASGVIPEPSTWAMMLLGFVSLGCIALRRRASMRAATGWRGSLVDHR
jgi:hypothetical protein